MDAAKNLNESAVESAASFMCQQTGILLRMQAISLCKVKETGSAIQGKISYEHAGKSEYDQGKGARFICPQAKKNCIAVKCAES